MSAGVGAWLTIRMSKDIRLRMQVCSVLKLRDMVLHSCSLARFPDASDLLGRPDLKMDAIREELRPHICVKERRARILCDVFLSNSW